MTYEIHVPTLLTHIPENIVTKTNVPDLRPLKRPSISKCHKHIVSCVVDEEYVMVKYIHTESYNKKQD